jgi:hypothetical protein
MNTVLAIFCLWFGVHWAYVLVVHAKAVNERQGLSLYWKVHILPVAFVGLVLDAAFNLTFGTVMFRELPHELLFSSRVQRHVRSGGKRSRLARFWARQLNTFDPDHIKP